MIVDTDILIDYLRDREKAVKILNRHRSDRAVETTDINVFELYHGAYRSENTDQNLSNLKGFLNSVRVHSTTENSMELAGKIAAELDSEGSKIGAKDILVSSMALVNNKPVLTYNKKHFNKIDELELLETEPDN